MKNKENEVIEPEVIDSESHFGDDYVEQSAFESIQNISNYNTLVSKLKSLDDFDEITELIESEKTYSKVIGRELMVNTIYFTKPPLATNESEKEALITAFGFLYAMATVGEYPLPSLYANHIGMGLEEFFMNLTDSTSPNRDVHAWVYNILETVNQMNMVRKNGDLTARKWQEESGEFKVKAVDRMTQTNVRNLIDETKKLGETINYKELMRSDRGK
jgi:hypothetical protein